MKAATEHKPSGLAVAAQVATEPGDGKQRIADRGPTWQRGL
jgi:hypothetical protein